METGPVDVYGFSCKGFTVKVHLGHHASHKRTCAHPLSKAMKRDGKVGAGELELAAPGGSRIKL